MLCGKKIEESLLKTKEESKDWMDSSIQLQASKPPAAVGLFCSLLGSYSQFSPDGAVMQDCGPQSRCRAKETEHNFSNTANKGFWATGP